MGKISFWQAMFKNIAVYTGHSLKKPKDVVREHWPERLIQGANRSGRPALISRSRETEDLMVNYLGKKITDNPTADGRIQRQYWVYSPMSGTDRHLLNSIFITV